MADTKISALTELTAPVSGDFLAIVDTSATATKKIDYDLISNNVFNVKAYGATGDGSTDDTASIQAAIDAAEVAGGVVVVPVGVYIVRLNVSNNALEIRADDVEIRLESGAVVKLGDTEISGSGQGRVLDIGTGAAAISRISLTGQGWWDWNNASNVTSAGIATSPIVRINSLVTDVYISTNFRNSGKTTTNQNGGGIYIIGSSGNEVQRATIVGCKFNDVGEALTAEFATDTVFSNNHVLDATEDGIEFAEGSFRWNISDNIFFGVNQSGIDIFEDSSDGVISGNTIIDCGKESGASISIGAASAGTDGGADISVNGNTITGNANSGGITTRNGGDTNLQRLNITNNVISDIAGNGIDIVANSIDIVIANNYVDNAGQGSGASVGINVAPAAEHIPVTGNFVARSASHGFYLRGTNCNISCNTAKNNNLSASAGGAGFRIHTTDLSVIGNVSYDDQGTPTQARGFDFISTDAASVIVAYNRAYNNTANQIRISSGSIRNNNNIGAITDPAGGGSEGTASLTAGTVTVSTTAIKTGDEVLLVRQATGGTLGHLSLGTITNGTSFVINSSSGTDTSTIYWQIVPV